MKKKGFTLIELLAVIIILGILLLIAVPTITKYLKRGTLEYYHSLENEMKTTGMDYLETYRSLLPRQIGNVTVIDLDELVANKYIDEVVDENGNVCSGKVTVKKTKTDKFEYYSCLDCGNSYKSEEDSCKHSEDDNYYDDQDDYEVIVEKDSYTVCQGENFTLPYGKAYYKVNELVSDKVEGKPNKIDTNKLATTKVKYSYHGASKEITVEVKDCTNPSNPEVVLKHDNKNGTSYLGNWYSGNIYQKFKSTDYTKPGILGSGIKEYLISTDGQNFEKVENGDYKIDTENGEHIRWVKSVDNAGNPSGTTKYTFKIDKKAPTCILVASGTGPVNGWYSSDVTVNWKEDGRDGTYSNYIQSAITQTKVTTEGETKVIGTITDEAGNVGSCSIPVAIDKYDPEVTITPDSGTYSTNKTIKITADDANYKNMQITITRDGNSKVQTTTTNKEYSYPTDEAGTWKVTVTAYDKAGKSTTATKEYIIGTQCNLEVKGGTLNGNIGSESLEWYTNNDVVTVGWASTRTDAVYSINATTESSTTDPITGTNSVMIGKDGIYQVTGMVTIDGKTETCKLEVKIDSTAPTCELTIDNNGNTDDDKDGKYEKAIPVKVTLSSSTDNMSGIEPDSYSMSKSIVDKGVTYYEKDEEGTLTTSETNKDRKTDVLVANYDGVTTITGIVYDKAGNRGTCTETIDIEPQNNVVVKMLPPAGSAEYNTYDLGRLAVRVYNETESFEKSSSYTKYNIYTGNNSGVFRDDIIASGNVIISANPDVTGTILPQISGYSSILKYGYAIIEIETKNDNNFINRYYIAEYTTLSLMIVPGYENYLLISRSDDEGYNTSYCFECPYIGSGYEYLQNSTTCNLDNLCKADCNSANLALGKANHSLGNVISGGVHKGGSTDQNVFFNISLLNDTSLTGIDSTEVYKAIKEISNEVTHFFEYNVYSDEDCDGTVCEHNIKWCNSDACTSTDEYMCPNN